jgi:hypothetical protein
MRRSSNVSKLQAIASIVHDRLPGLLGKRLPIVQVHHGFDLGIATWTRSYHEAHDAAAWRKRVGEVPCPVHQDAEGPDADPSVLAFSS